MEQAKIKTDMGSRSSVGWGNLRPFTEGWQVSVTDGQVRCEQSGILRIFFLFSYWKEKLQAPKETHIWKRRCARHSKTHLPQFSLCLSIDPFSLPLPYSFIPFEKAIKRRGKRSLRNCEKKIGSMGKEVGQGVNKWDQAKKREKS